LRTRTTQKANQPSQNVETNSFSNIKEKEENIDKDKISAFRLKESKKSSTGGDDDPNTSFQGLKNFSKISILTTKSIPLQAKLKINPPNDKYEQEADRIANQIVQNSPSGSKPNPIQFPPNPIQRTFLQTKSEQGTGMSVSPSFSNRLQNTKGTGFPLSENTRSLMEPQLGMDLSKVRIHTNPQAVQLNKEIKAKAFTVGSDVYFNAGQFSPNSTDGKGLLAHELVHTVQQSRTSYPQLIQRKGSLEEETQPEEITTDDEGSSLENPKAILYEISEENKHEFNNTGFKFYRADGGKLSNGRVRNFIKRKKREDVEEFKSAFPFTTEGTGEPPQYTIDNPRGKYKYYKFTDDLSFGKGIQPNDSIKIAEVSTQTTDDLFTDGNYVNRNEAGIVYQEEGANVRNSPVKGATLLKHLNQNEKVFILKHNPKSKWYAVTTDDGVFGYVADWLIWRNLPEPNVNVLKIPSGRSAIGIAEEFYGDKFKSWGNDLRFVVNALAFANNREDHNGIGKPGIFKPNGNDQSWADTEVTKDVYIWLPSASFLDSLRDKVSSGSISYEVWEGVKTVLNALAFGAAFIGGVLHGAFDGLVALVKGVFDLIWGAIKSIFTGSIWSDLKNIWTAVTSMGLEDWKELFFGWMDPYLEKTESDNPFTSGHAYGYITGRILFEIVSLFVGGTAVAKIASKLGKLASKLGKFKIIQKIGNGVNKIGGKAKAGIEKLKAVIGKNKVDNLTGTVWDDIVPTQASYPGSVLPKSLELSLLNGKKVWIHPNATKHLDEFAMAKATNFTPEVVRLTIQQQLRSLQAAINLATKEGIIYDKIIKFGGWELKFGAPKGTGNLPVLFHALQL